MDTAATQEKQPAANPDVAAQDSIQEVRDAIVATLDELPPASLEVVRQFVAFLREQSRQGRPVVAAPKKDVPYRYPTVPVPASSLDAFTGILPPVGGDALADTEALYDEA